MKTTSGCLAKKAPKFARVKEVMSELPATKRTDGDVQRVFKARYGETVSKELVALVRNGYAPHQRVRPIRIAVEAPAKPAVNPRGRPVLTDSNELRRAGEIIRTFGGADKVREFIKAVEACGGTKRVARLLSTIESI